MGVDKSPKGKADDDFEKRTREFPPEEQRRLAFVFVTPRVWQKKDEWAEDKGSKSQWRAVVALDANDLEHWLEIAPAVDVWFMGLTGRVPQGAQGFQSYWNTVRGIAEHPLKPSVFTVSREAEIAAVQNWLAGSPSSLFMRTYGMNEGLDFLAALSESDEKIQNGVIVYTKEAWRHLAASREPLVLLADPALERPASEIAGAVGAGHHVFVSGPRGALGQGAGEDLRRQDHLSISEALQTCGFSDPRARALGQACCGSSTILKRLITRHPETRFPEWCRDEVRALLAPFALIGGWAHVDPPKGSTAPRIGAPPPHDVWVVTELLGCTREELDGLVARWQRASEPLFLRFGNSVLVASREDAWHLLGGSVSKEQLQRFREFALLVLDEDNPAFQLEPEQRWLANLYGKVHSLSTELRRSIIETLALMATYPTAEVDSGLDFNGAVQWVLELALPRHATWQRWASFGNNLMVIAEAAPELCLARVEDDLNSESPELPKLFQDQSHSIFARAIHSDLLWSLEGLAWSPQYLSRVAVVLAKLAARDPGGTYVNRPANSLREVFLPWLWHTNASTEERLQALSRLVETEPEVGWKLLTGLLPGKMPRMSSNTSMPRWRQWAEGWSRAKLQSQLPEYALAVAELTMTVADSDARRWADALDGMLRISHETTEGVLAALGTIADAPGRTDEAMFPLWEELRKILAKHEQYASAHWAFPADLRERLAAIRDRLAPGDSVLLHHWLFEHYPIHLSGFDPVEDHQAYQTALHEAQLAALRQIVSSAGAAGVFRLLGLSVAANVVGWVTGEERLLSPEDIGLPGVLESTDGQRFNFVSAYLMCRFLREGWPFVNTIPTAGWVPRQVATFACCLPFGGETWRWLQRFGPEVEREYWCHVRAFLRQPDLEQVRTACQALIGVGRPFSAADVMHSALHDKLPLPSDLIAEILEATFRTSSSEGAREVNAVSYGLQQLVKALQQDNSFDRMRLAGIEWGLLPLLDRETSEVKPRTLVSVVESTPEFYVHLLTTVFRGENDPPADTPLSEQEQIRAGYARELLDSLARLPGTNDQGVVDHRYLRSWAEEVRSRAVDCDRLGICDYTLGEVIARASISPKGNWPSPEVAKFIEEVGTESLFRGFEIAVLNGRGTVGRGPWEGGGQERSLAARYRELAEHARPSSPKLAEVFLRLARQYDVDARQEDEGAERRKLGR
jgi:hypothetical protein